MFMRLTELTFDQTGVQVRQKQQQAKRTKHVQPAHSGRHARNGGRPSAADSHNHVQAQLQPQPQMQQQTAQQQVLLQLQQHQQQAPMHSHPNLPQGSLQVGSPGAAPAIDFIAWKLPRGTASLQPRCSCRSKTNAANSGRIFAAYPCPMLHFACSD